MRKNNNYLVLRSTVKAWLKNREKRPAWLAQSANINPSILSRFLNGATALNEITALRLFKVMKWDMSPDEREQFIEAAGLHDLLDDVAHTVAPKLPTVELATSENAFITGLSYLSTADTMTGSYQEKISLYQKAEQLFGPGSTNAAYAAIMIAHNLTISGDITGADEQFARIASTYERIMDPSTRMRYCEARGYMEFDRANLSASARWHRECIEISKTTGQWMDAHDSFSHIVFISLEIVNGTPDAPGVAEQLKVAELYLELFKQNLDRHPNAEVHLPGYYLTRAKLHRAQGYYEDAKRDLRIVRRVKLDALQPPGTFQTDLEDAEIALALGDTDEATRLATPALEFWSLRNYAGGASRATRILATAALMDNEENGAKALELALAAACINPFGTYQDRARLDAVLAEANALTHRAQLTRDYKRLITRLRHKAEEHQGVFAPLATIAPTPRASLDDIFNRVTRSSIE